MRLRARGLLAAAALLAGAAAARAQEPPPIDLAEARRAFDAAKALSDADGGRLWGKPLYGPVFLVDRSTGFVAADRPDSAGALHERDGVWVGTLPESISPANTAVEWNGRKWTMVMWPLPPTPYARNRLLLHEMFHRIQADVGLPATNPLNAHLDRERARIDLRLEMRALSEALIRDGEARRRAVEDALAFRHERRTLFPDGAADEVALERNEGMAEYTGLVLSGLPDGVLADRAAVGLQRRDDSDSFSRSFAYATGPAYGVLLDRSGMEWRERLVGGATLADLLGEAYGVQPSERHVSSRWEPYDGFRVVVEETAREKARVAREAELRARFVEGPVLRVTPGSDFSFSFDPNDATNLAGLGTVYGSTRVTDSWGVLEVSSGGALFLRNEKGWITGVVVPVSPDAAGSPAAGNGWTLKLADGWAVVPGERAGDWVLKGPETP